MTSSRRDFLQRSASAAAAISLAPLSPLEAASAMTVPELADAQSPAVRAFELRMLKARPVPLANVRLLGGPLKAVQDLTAQYLLSLDADRMMAYYRIRAGLPKKGEPYGGWDGDGRNLTGHIAGHHLSAVSLMYAATGDARFKARAEYLVKELRDVQDRNGDGYAGALEGLREAFAKVSRGEIRSGGFDLNGLWSPWYTLHKTFAGLRDAYRYAGIAPALGVETKFAGWAEGVLAPLNDQQVQKMLLTEHGGMNEVLADLYADTGDRRWLNLSYRFEHHAFTDPLKRGQDNLSGKHGNCQIPKLIGSAARYGYTGDTGDILSAAFFWDRVAQHHSYATGGHGLAEYFGPPDELSRRVDGRTCESCNVYNMLKLTRRLFSLRPDAAYADFHERALFNHVLASVDQLDYHTSYMVPVGRGEQQEYQNMQQSFTCCVGTGMENHALHGYGIFYESPDGEAPTLWVNLFVPSRARFPATGASVEMASGFPDGDDASIRLALPSPKKLTLSIRRPYWAGDGFAIRVNGEPVPQPPVASLSDAAAGGRRGAPGNEAARNSSSYVELTRTWKNGDTIELALPKAVVLEPTPDDHSVAAVMWGPLVLSGDLGARREGRNAVEPPIPLLVAAGRPVAEWIVPDEKTRGNFSARGVARYLGQPDAAPGDVALVPFYRSWERTYSVYFDVITPANFDARVKALEAQREHARKLEAATVASVRLGDRQGESAANYRSEPADRPITRSGGRSGRGGAGWFSYDLAVDASEEMALVVTYFNELGLPPAAGDFEIQVDGARVAAFQPDADAIGFWDAQYAIPSDTTRGKTKVTVRFQAAGDGRIAPVFGVRIIRAKAM